MTAPGVRLCMGLLVLLVGVSVPLAAQVTTGTISGTVLDESQAVLPGVSIVITDVETGQSRALTTDKEGRYRAVELPPGRYRVRAELAGFGSAVREGITLTVGREAVISLVLSIGAVSEELVVTGEAPLVDTSSSVMRGLVGEKEIEQLPLNGRSFVQLATLSAGVSFMRTSSDSGSLSVAGGRAGQNSFLLDGTTTNDATNKTPVSKAGVLLGAETIREFSVLTSNFSAEFGRGSGGVINAITKSGTNVLHGSVFEFHRNDALDARGFFDPADGPPDFARNQYGGSAGGPIQKNRLFFFGAYEGFRQHLGVTTISRVPGPQLRAGFVRDRAGELVNVGVSPLVAPYLALYPDPNGQLFADGTGEFSFTDNQIAREHFGQARIDYTMGTKDSIFGRYTYSNSLSENSYAFPGFLTRGTETKHIITLEEKRILSSSTLNVVRIGLNRTTPSNDDYSPGVDPALSFARGQALGNIGVTGLGSLGTGLTYPRVLSQNSFQVSDSLTLQRGAHGWKLGAQLEHIDVDYYSSSRLRGSYNFDSIEDFLRGRASRFEIEAATGTKKGVSIRQNVIAWYIQDDIALAQRFTVNVGLRHEFFTTPTEADGQVVNIRDITAVDPIVMGDPFIRNPSYRSFAPRAGAAWDPVGDGKMSVRGGFGMYFNPIMVYEIRNAFSDLPPISNRVRLNSPPFPNGIDAVGRGAAVILPKTVQFDPPSSYTVRWNVDVQREVLPGTVASIGYVGARGVNLMFLRDINEPPPTAILPDGREFREAGARRVNLAFSETRQSAWGASSHYHGLLAAVRKKLATGWQGQMSYTWSKSIDNASGTDKREFAQSTNIATTPYNPDFDRGLSNYDARHVFSANVSVEVPFGSGRRFLSNGGVLSAIVGGWDVNGIVSLVSGYPFTMRAGFDIDRNDETDADRPNLVPGANNNPVLGVDDPNNYFDSTAFVLQAPGFRGDLGRNTLTGPGFATVDMSVVRNVHLPRAARAELRLELFNLLDHVNFAPPLFPALADSRGRPLAAPGRLTQTVGTPREIQLGFRVIW